jgi:hypothetical protein
MSPMFVGYALFHRKSKSPRWKAGSILPDSTTTIGDGESAAIERPFHIIKAVDMIKAKLSSCERRDRGDMDDILVLGVDCERVW